MTNPFSGEGINPITSARVVDVGVSLSRYLTQEEGVNRGDKEYCVSRSDLMEVLDCPHKWRAGYEEKDTTYTDWGSVIDCLALTPEKTDAAIAVCPETYIDSKSGEPKPWDFRSKDRKEWRDRQGGKLILKVDVWTQANNAIKFLFGHREIRELINCSQKQVLVMGEYQDKSTGIIVPVKALLDIVPAKDHLYFGKVLADLKTTTNASMGVWTMKIAEMGYHAQAALHHDLYVRATGEDRTDFWHVVQESGPPWEPVLRKLSLEFVDIGQRKYLAALKLYCACLAADYWPGYPAPQPDGFLQPREWMMSEWIPTPEDFGVKKALPPPTQQPADDVPH